jgi:hypothetical protein
MHLSSLLVRCILHRGKKNSERTEDNDLVFERTEDDDLLFERTEDADLPFEVSASLATGDK